MPERGAAFFDLDHTILPFDTQAFFANFVLKKEGWRRVYLLWFLPVGLLAGLKVVSLRFAKRVFLSYLVGIPRERLESYVDEFVASDFAAATYPEVVAEIGRQREEGRRLILNSASPTLYLEAIAKHLGFDDWLGTEMVLPEKLPLMPQLTGPNNKHEAKVIAMLERGLIPSTDQREKLGDTWAYSDSSADLPMLRLAEHAVMIHPSEKLAAIGDEEGWRYLTPHRPYLSKWGGRVASALQMLGGYSLPDQWRRGE
ncbi:MAG: HAD-IB family hydrolase [Verrucomicrobiota bacterium]